MTDEMRMNGIQKEPFRFVEVDNYPPPMELKQTRSMQSISNSVASDSGVFSYVRQPQVADDRTEMSGDLPILLREKRFVQRTHPLSFTGMPTPPPQPQLNSISNKLTHSSSYSNIHSMRNTPNGMPDDVAGGLSTLHFRRNINRNLTGSQEISPGTPYLNRPISYNRNTSHTPSLCRSVGALSVFHQAENVMAKGSTKEDKSKMTRRFLVTVCAISYAIFLVVFGAVVFIGDVVVSQYPLPQAFCIYMLVLAFAYFLFLFVDIRTNVNRARKGLRERVARQQIIDEYAAKTSMDIDGPLEFRDVSTVALHQRIIHELNLAPIKSVPHKYCFATGRHGEFLYLKLGAAWFAFGLLIHSALQISYQILFLSQSGDKFYKCASYITLALDILFPIYSIFILFFIFKYMNVIINEHRALARFFLMHAIGTSLAFWVYTIIRETADAIARSDSEEYGVMVKSLIDETLIVIYNDCGQHNTSLNTIHRQFSPYLYPFIIEYCILVVGIWYMMWANINHCPKKKPTSNHGNVDDPHNAPNDSNDQATTTSTSSEQCVKDVDHENDLKTNSFVYADCQASFRGLFCGLLLVVITIVFTILLFVGVNNDLYTVTSIVINGIFELIVLMAMLIATLFAYIQTTQLDINHHSISKLDDILLFIAIPAFFLDTTFSMVPAIVNGSILKICIITAQLVQVLIQTPFIIDALRRCSNTSQLQAKKPGRELVIFLTIANVSLWIFYTFSVKTAYTGDDRYAFYGYTLWNILNHISLPLIMFYRFHSSVCLVDIWKHSYEPAPADDHH